MYFYDNGQELAKYVVQMAEKELPQIEGAAEYSLQRRANIILYNHYTDKRQTNIGLETDILNTDATTTLVNNKMVVYFTSNHADLKNRCARALPTSSQRMYSLATISGKWPETKHCSICPKWLTDGYVAYLGENWSTELDDELKSEILSGNYTKFSSLAFEKPLLYRSCILVISSKRNIKRKCHLFPLPGQGL